MNVQLAVVAVDLVVVVEGKGEEDVVNCFVVVWRCCLYERDLGLYTFRVYFGLGLSWYEVERIGGNESRCKIVFLSTTTAFFLHGF